MSRIAKICEQYPVRLMTLLMGSTVLVALLLYAHAATSADVMALVSPEKRPAVGQLSKMATLGKRIFHDVALSASGQQSCATCHVPNRAFTANDDQPVPFGGGDMTLQGFRNSPTLLYAQFTPTFGQLPGIPPFGGMMWDGRAAGLAEQATLPFTSPAEMANATTADVRQRLLARPYVDLFKEVFGKPVLNNADDTVKAMGRAVAAYEQEDPEFAPFSSKFDRVSQGRAQFNAQELRGLQLFNAPAKGNCASCHSSSPVNTSLPALFTSATYHNNGAPRNWNIAHNRDNIAAPSFVPQNGLTLGAPFHKFYDLGLCGPFRADFAGQAEKCGMFKSPTLRNVAIKQFYFHNGVFKNLQQVVDFYVTRDITPTKWYIKADGMTPDIRFNDLPLAYAAHVPTNKAPFLPLNGRPRLTETEINDVVVFMCTLTDGYNPSEPAGYRYPAQCKKAAGMVS
ncbi:cytochrome c peroxidase [Chitinivorax sp. B]|uniref:cytochrome-c peroxidase n=1 Tax=Chitinivorax sp. B TaxID=2502235 RepID=UPI0010F7A45A|nr:cytochrome c peroxidase [Chitinivorax sp. B]